MVLSKERPGSEYIKLQIDPRDIHVFDKNTGENLRHNCDSRFGSSQS
jgi:hypothetical protein